jgi:hypothetical protein
VESPAVRTSLPTDRDAIRPLWRRAACAAFGHRVGNRYFTTNPAGRQCPCGDTYLAEDGSETRASHTLGCFFFGHRYTKLAERDGHAEYTCDVCGHPVLFALGDSRYAAKTAFRKQTRYLCGLLGHTVHKVADRLGTTEYACHCGHSFLRGGPEAATIRHPLVCVFAGHFIRFFERRGERSEFVCRNCGHTFCFGPRA